ncbi:hypothetical protein B0H17DRAFT_1212943 [Mycena rosella]|uniref:Uncharacterized protein n=1 Tax=Mycena rosella TaxID=1033263 RepID=A0AAD7CR63_MYCRO|nr:hypothetical protein B0H17DRAFT_1212943 [Mycena rosella]
MAVGLSTIPLDTQLELLPAIRRPSVVFDKSVTQNYFGDLLEDAVILVNTQSERCYSGPNPRDYKSSFIKKLLSNEGVLEKVLSIVFRFLIHNNASIISKGSEEDRVPTSTELFRFKRAAYRFWTFSTGERENGSWFLSKFPDAELSEIGHFHSGVRAWVAEMYGPERMAFDSDHEANAFSAIVSSGLGRLSWLWKLFLNMIDDRGDEHATDIFEESLGISMDGDGEGFFTYEFYDCWAHRSIEIDKIQPIFDKGHDWLKAILQVEERASSASDRIDEVSSTFKLELCTYGFNQN